MVQRGPLLAAASCLAVALGLAAAGAVTMPGLVAVAAYAIGSNLLLASALRRAGTVGLGWANTVTSLRSGLVGLITGVVVTSFTGLTGLTISDPTISSQVPLLLGLCVPALVLDGVDGWVARRTRTATSVGARFDMEVDAFLLLVLSVYVAPVLGAWVLAIGLMRYVFVAAGWLFPSLRAPLPARYWRKVVAATQGVALVVAVAGPPRLLAASVLLVALGLLVESFGRDVVWLLYRSRVQVAVQPQRVG